MKAVKLVIGVLAHHYVERFSSKEEMELNRWASKDSIAILIVKSQPQKHNMTGCAQEKNICETLDCNPCTCI